MKPEGIFAFELTTMFAQKNEKKDRPAGRLGTHEFGGVANRWVATINVGESTRILYFLFRLLKSHFFLI